MLTIHYREILAFMLKILTLCLSFLLGSCMVGPDYKEPKKDIEQHWLQTNPKASKLPSDNANWWNVFKDPTLTSLINQGYNNNLTLQIAGVRVLQARAQLAQSVGELYPQQQAFNGNYSYYRLGGSQLQSLLPPDFLTASLGASATWELDFWGKYRRAILSNNALFLASLAAYDQALVSLTADIANAYINIRTDQKLIKITKLNIRLQTESLKIAKARYKGGQTSLLDVEQAKTELSQTQSQLPPIYSNLQQQKDALAVLLGITPNEVDKLLIHSRGIPKASGVVATSIPKEVIGRRPDVYQSRMEAIAQSELIGAVKANLYPSLSLAGSFTFSSTNINGSSISDLFNWSNRSIVAGPSFIWPFLSYGQITNAVRVQDAAFQQSLLNYLNLVLKVQQEVQDNITRYLQSRNAEFYLVQATHSAVQSTHLAIIRYKEGEAIYTTVLDAERQQLQVQTSLINSEGNVSLSLVALYRSLGGGWQIRKGNDIVSEQIKSEMAARTNWGNLLIPQNHEEPASNLKRLKELFLPNW